MRKVVPVQFLAIAMDGLGVILQLERRLKLHARTLVHIGRAIVMALMAMRGQSSVGNDQTKYFALQVYN
jgi:hypothetical protein